MPDISALNGTAINNVAEFDGLTVTEAVVGAPAAAYSVRLLDSALGVPTYTGAAMRIRRVTGAGQAGNDDEADVGFDSNDVISLESPVSNFSVGGSNATTLGQFLNVGTVNSIAYTDADSLTNTAAAYVDEWKDQSGNGNDAEQGTPSAQPQIHVGTVDTDLILENGKPAIYFNGGKTLSHSSNISFTSSTMHCVIYRENLVRVWYGIASGWYAAYTGNQVRTSYASIQQVTKITGQVNYIHTYDGSNVATWYEDNSSLGSSNVGTTTATYNSIGGFASYKHRSNLQELILWGTEQSSTNVAGIASNAVNYYNIT